MKRISILTIISLGLLSLSMLASARQANTIAEHEPPELSVSFQFEEKTGQALFEGICQGCHMPAGEGAKGAAAYPPLANNPKLAGAAYPVYLVLKGQGGMPAFSRNLNDEQVAEVVNYVRSHFGNQYADKVQATDVAKLR